LAGTFLTDLARGVLPIKKKVMMHTLRTLMEEHYLPSMDAARKGSDDQRYMIFRNFDFLLDTKLDDISVIDVERWRNNRRDEGVTCATVNRPVVILKAVLNWGVKRDILKENPLRRLELLPETDSNKKTRFLSPEERVRLMTALDAREAEMRVAREQHNLWLIERGKRPMPPLGHFADHIKPMIITALNTALRQGDLFNLRWSAIDFSTGIISVVPSKTKESSGKLLSIPMNETLRSTLWSWREQSADTKPSALIFPSPVTGGVLDNVKKAWATVLKAAQIENFRWHDMRHDFASQLVSRGTDLNTVRELLGHSDMKMTLRYAHLAPENKLKAVKLLDTEK
jgi:integrase